MDYEVLNQGSGITPLGGAANGICPDVNGVCPSANICPDVDVVCGGDSGGDEGNIFPCANPGLGCGNGNCGPLHGYCTAPQSIGVIGF